MEGGLAEDFTALRDAGSAVIQSVRPSLTGALKKTTAGTSAATAALACDAVYIAVEQGTWLAWGSSPTASAGDGSVFLPAGAWVVWPWKSGDKLAYIQNTIAGALNVAPITTPTGG